MLQLIEISIDRSVLINVLQLVVSRYSININWDHRIQSESARISDGGGCARWPYSRGCVWTTCQQMSGECYSDNRRKTQTFGTRTCLNVEEKKRLFWNVLLWLLGDHGRISRQTRFPNISQRNGSLNATVNSALSKCSVRLGLRPRERSSHLESASFPVHI